MKNNNLSNRSALTILVRVEDFLIEYKNKTLWDKIANFAVGKDARATVNEDVLFLINLIFRHTDMTVDLVVDLKNYYKTNMDLLLDGIPFGRLLVVEKPVQISTKLNIGEYAYYVDNNPERISLVNNKRCISLEQLNTYIRGGYTFE